MNDLFAVNQSLAGSNQKMDINNLNSIEERVILIKEAFEKTKNERERLLAEIKAKDEEINGLKNKIAQNEAENDIIIKKVDNIIADLESIQL